MSKTVIEMAREVGAHKVCEADPLCSIGLMAFETHELERLVELARADERAKLAEQPAPMLQPNRVISYAAAMKLRELGYEWMNDEWKHLDELAEQQAQQEPVGCEWTPCMKLPVVVHVRKQYLGEAHVSTREGITPVHPDDLIMRGVSGEEYPIGRAIFEQTYTLDTAPQAQPAPAQHEPAYTYTSTQATRCARCGEHKHTPLRIDSMGGYVCLTCIDKQLCTFYGEFGYPEPAPVPGVVLRDGQPTLLRDRDIKTTDVRLCVIKENQS